MEEKKEVPKGPPQPHIVKRPAGRTYSSDAYTRRYLDSLVVEMRIIGSKLADTSTVFFGKELRTPIMFGVMGGYQNDPQAYTNQAAATAATGTVMWISGFATQMETAACVNAGANVIKVVKPHLDNARLIRELQEAEAQGCFAVASDLDHAYTKDGKLDETPIFTLGPKSEKDLREIVNALRVPFIAKGILSVQDALACQRAGVAGIVLSHHHGIMDCAVPPVMILPRIREAVGPDYPIIVDCGIDTGADAFKALVLGADAVCTARAAMSVLTRGEEAVADFMERMTDELRHFMERTGAADLQHLDPDSVHRMPFGM